ncbi:unnamed protein product [Gongylonema pulchrum]|uniref:Ras-GAP domain-containing protein n=1 Tax=Gongylonema pulchrum TaxID=637853 RepID=A0A183ESG9_9BILA|nr:unnamed protein product [Gongylonema pulchrum]
MRADSCIYADIGLQEQVLEMLLSFHPFYLRLGLETVLSLQINTGMDGTNYYKILASIVAQNLFRSPKIMKDSRYVQGRAKTIVRKEGAKALQQHFLTKICQFLFIISEARNDDVISLKHRCLFVKSSSYKSFTDVLAMLSRELMTGAINLPKVLSHLGVTLTFKQGFFDEIDYHVKNLSKDLCDGIILG